MTPRVDENSKILISAFLFFSSVAALGQTSFDAYFAKNNKHRSGAREAGFVDACGVKRSNAQIIYGLSTEVEGYKLHRTPSLLRGRDEAQTDFFASVEEWKVNGKPRFINAWTLVMDEGSESNDMYCLDEKGKLTLYESLNAPDAEMSDGAGWIYVQRFSFDTGGVMKPLYRGYVHKDGSPAARKLNGKNGAIAKGAPDKEFACKIIAALAR